MWWWSSRKWRLTILLWLTEVCHIHIGKENRSQTKGDEGQRQIKFQELKKWLLILLLDALRLPTTPSGERNFNVQLIVEVEGVLSIHQNSCHMSPPLWTLLKKPSLLVCHKKKLRHTGFCSSNNINDGWCYLCNSNAIRKIIGNDKNISTCSLSPHPSNWFPSKSFPRMFSHPQIFFPPA